MLQNIGWKKNDIDILAIQETQMNQNAEQTRKNYTWYFGCNEKDKSNLFLEINGNNSIYNYYAGFGWKKSGQFESKSDWNNYLEHFSKCLKNPLQVSIIEQNKEL